MEENQVLKEALRYRRKLGWAVIPLRPGTKEPLVAWKKYQKKKPSPAQIRKWWGRWPDANIGIVTGKVSGLVVIDGDEEKAEAFLREKGGLPSTPSSRASRGLHRYFKYPEKEVIPSRSFKELGFDVKSEGGLIVAPPSIHPSGKKYRWEKGLSPFDFRPKGLKGWVLQFIKNNVGGGDSMKIKTSPADWKKARMIISDKPRILAHLNNPKPSDRSGHDWKLARLCIEEGIEDESILFQIILNNPHGKAKSRKDPGKFVTGLICNAKQKSAPQSSLGSLRFPKEAIGGLAKEFVDLFSSCLESPWEFWAFSFLTCLGSVAADRARLSSALEVQPRLFAVLLGESADSRKSEAIHQTIDFFKNTLPGEFFKCGGAGSAEGLASKLEKEPKTLLFYDEFKLFMSKAVPKTSALLPLVNSLFERNEYESKTKAHSIKLDACYLSLLAASTTDTFLHMFPPSFIDIGFFNRLWLVPGESKPEHAIPPTIPKSEKDALAAKLTALVNSNPKGGPKFKLTKKARKTFEEWYLKTPRSLYRKRLDTYGHRLMVLFAVNESEPRVTQHIVKRVIQLLNWQLEVRRANDPIDAETKIAKMEMSIRRALSGSQGGLSKRVLKRKVHYERSGISMFKTALANLKEAREVAFDRKTRSYILNKSLSP